MASLLSQATSYFNRTNISANYAIQDHLPPIRCGLWKVYKAYSKASASGGGVAGGSGGGGAGVAGVGAGAAQKGEAGEDGKVWVSVWVHNLSERGSVRSAVVEQLKKEASSLLRLRHPCILSAVEPLEETRSLLSFATEPVLSTLTTAMGQSHGGGGGGGGVGDVALDEVEIQKGLLQVARALEFLHEKNFVHGNLESDAVLVNAKGDWKLAGFGFLTATKLPDGSPAPYVHPDYDPSLPPALSRNFDYLAPEYALDEQLLPANDVYALGCLLFAVHARGSPPFRNHNSLATLRANVEELGTARGRREWQRLGKDVLDVLALLLTRYPNPRPTARSFQENKYFNNILVKTLKFMERDSFAGRSREERVQFLKGLLKILPQFSDRLQRRKVLPALLELMNDRQLLPYILPLIFAISKNVSSLEFTGKVLPEIKPLFKLQDPPQNQMILLDQVELFVTKTTPQVFREEVTPLLYSALDSEQVSVQERALQTVPRLCEVLEYSHVKEVLFPAIAKLFAKTKILSVKCNTLICFHSMIKVLDKYTLTEKLVPILARIKTREPSVMVATLAVHEAMSKKVDRETLATEIIPQLWRMSMGAQLNADQFRRFMAAVKEMGDRVEKEHTAHLREAMRMQEHTDSFVGGGASNPLGATGLGNGQSGISSTGEIDFEALVGSTQGGARVAGDMSAKTLDSFDPWDWDAPAGGGSSGIATPDVSTPGLLTPSHTGASAATAAVATRKANLGASSKGALKLNGNAAANSLSRMLSPPPPPPPLAAPSAAVAEQRKPSVPTLPPPGWTGSVLSPAPKSGASAPTASSSSPSVGGGATSTGAPNYHVVLEPAKNFGTSTTSTTAPASGLSMAAPRVAGSLAPAPATTSSSSTPTPPGWSGGGGLLQPQTTTKTATAKTVEPNNDDWGEFDPW